MSDVGNDALLNDEHLSKLKIQHPQGLQAGGRCDLQEDHQWAIRQRMAVSCATALPAHRGCGDPKVRQTLAVLRSIALTRLMQHAPNWTSRAYVCRPVGMKRI